MGLCPLRVSAVPVVFTVDSSQSQLTASGKLFANTFSPQAPGSLTTTYSGTINADLTDTTIQFTGGSLIAAQTNGIWQPAQGGVAGIAPADYGATNNAVLQIGINNVPGNFAVRNLLLDLNSQQLPLSNGSFDGSSLVFSLITNTASIDYYYSSATTTTNSGSENLNGLSTNSIAIGSKISTNAGVRQLVLQISAQFNYSLLIHGINDTTINLTGQLVANIAPPIIQSIVNFTPNVVITTQNATAQSVLLVSTNLQNWSAASATISTNNSGMIVFTTPYVGANAFYRVQQ